MRTNRENRFIIVIVEYFSKRVAQNTTSKEFVRALLQWVSIFGVPREIRTDGGSQFTSQLSSDLCPLSGYHHLVVVAYHPQENDLVERRNKQLLNHLRSWCMKSEFEMFGAIISHLFKEFLITLLMDQLVRNR